MSQVALEAIVSFDQDAIDFVKARVITYLGTLGLRDAASMDKLSEECLQRARRRAAPGDRDELLRRALEEAQRRFEAAIARLMGVSGIKDFHIVAASRAALLLGGASDICIDSLMHGFEDQAESAARVNAWLKAALPQPTPPEASLPMHEHPISFFFSPSAKNRA